MRSKVLVPGTFDILHYGHMRFLSECAELGHVTVALSTDDHATQSKRRTVMTYMERRESLLHLPYVNLVTPKDQKELYPIILATGASTVCYGSDWDTEGWVRMNGLKPELLVNVTFVKIPNPQVISTTELIARASR